MKSEKIRKQFIEDAEDYIVYLEGRLQKCSEPRIFHNKKLINEIRELSEKLGKERYRLELLNNANPNNKESDE